MEGVNVMYLGEGAHCGRKVRTDENYQAAHVWTSTAALFHWNWFIVLMKQHGGGRGCHREGK
jgi:hypothetical protein